MVAKNFLFTEKANCKTISLKHFRQTIAISLVGVDSHKSSMGRPRSNCLQVNTKKQPTYRYMVHLDVARTAVQQMRPIEQNGCVQFVKSDFV
ncbi:hypothetical protein NQ314_000844 [Rhamnusium bicolor]|uniref:Uncharacterized protein n=1 Tax=Rhamnusium bicolor TaxID=1586634 RepID=A0AAV8ZV94_9CUCU|nr:hypothetical protein NQ314_000844 [Rhamnusium bicolor]